MFYQSKKDRDLDFFEEESFCDKKKCGHFYIWNSSQSFFTPSHTIKIPSKRNLKKKTLKPRKRNCAQTFFKVDKYVKK